MVWLVVLMLVCFICALGVGLYLAFKKPPEKNSRKKRRHYNADVPLFVKSEESPQTPPTDNVYNVIIGGRQKTLNKAQILCRLESGDINASTQAWRPGMTAWRPLHEFSEFDVPPPAPGAELNEFPVAMLALFIVPQMAAIYFFEWEMPWYAWLIYNSVFACWDMSILSKAGYGEKKFMWVLGFTLLPIYMICRAYITNRYRWMILYFLSFAVSFCALLYTEYAETSGDQSAPEKQETRQQYTLSDAVTQTPTEKPRDLANFYPSTDRIKVGDRFFYDPKCMLLNVKYHYGDKWLVLHGIEIIGIIDSPVWQYLDDRPLLGKSYVCTEIKRGKVYFKEVE